MTKEVAPLQANQITLTKRSRSHRIKSLLPDLNPPQSGLAQAAAPSSRLFKPPVSGSKWIERQRGGLFLAVLISGTIDAFAFPIGLSAGLSTPEPLGVLLLAATGLAQAMWLPAAILTTRIHRAKRLNFNAFLNWLHGRYGITLDSKQRLYGLLSKEYPGLVDDVPFVDDQGRQMIIKWSYGHDAFEILSGSEKREPLQLVDASLVSQPTRPAAELSYPLRQLYAQIQERFTTLAERDLSPESDHVVARAKRDVAKLVALYADLAHLHALDAEQEAAVQATFTSLVNELTEVVKKETAFALRELTVETTYVAARQEPKGIQLEK
jgi:hypothetical protein